MPLPDHVIKKMNIIDPFLPAEHRPGVISYGVSAYGYDIRIRNTFKVARTLYQGVMDPKNVNPLMFEDVTIPEGETLIVPPHGFVLATSVEYFNIPRSIVAICLGKSTYARCNIIINVTPLEPEWRGYLTIEISNPNPFPVRIYPNEGIAQVLFLPANGWPDDAWRWGFLQDEASDRQLSCEVSYADKKGKYQDQPASPVTAKVIE